MAASASIIFLILSVFYTTIVGSNANNAKLMDPGKACPHPEIIKPCTCEKYPYRDLVTLICENLDSEEILDRVLQNADDYQFGYFFLDKSSFMYIPTRLFQSRILKDITVSHSTLVSLFETTPPVNNSVESIFLLHVTLTRGIEWEQLSTLQQLNTLKFWVTPFHKFDKSFIKYAPKSLSMIKVTDCATKKIEDVSFTHLENLAQIYIQKDRIKEIKRSMFPTPAKIWYLDFSGNQIKTLPDDIFSGMPLFRVILANNLLTTISENIFQGVLPKLQIFDISSNPISCRCNIMWIIKPNSHPERFLGKCKSPINLNGKSLVDLVRNDFAQCF